MGRAYYLNIIDKGMKKKWKFGDFLHGKLLQKLIVMKVLIVFLFICSVNVSASSVYSQQKKMDVSLSNVSVIDVFRHVRQMYAQQMTGRL